MSAKYPARKNKRARSPTDDINNSFIKNVTARMSGLMPASVSKWFGCPRSSNANGSAPVAESSDSSTEDEAPEDQIFQPLSKKMRYSPASTSNDYAPKTKSTSTNTESTETFSIVKSPISTSTFRPETDITSTPRHSPSENVMQIHNTITGYNSVIRNRKSLFDIPDDERSYKKLPPPDSVQGGSEPQIKRSLLGSPFYAGRTRYGGAAGSYMPDIKRRKIALVSESANNDSFTMSHATKRVMDLLENYSSPLVEAKRISQCVKTSKSFDNSRPKNAYKTQELYIQSMAKILQFRQRTRQMGSTKIARQIIASNSSSVAVQPNTASQTQCNNPKETTDKLTTKIKVNLTRANRNDKAVGATDEPAPVHLPTAVLQIDQNNLPKFTFGTSTGTETLSDIATHICKEIDAVETSANATNSKSVTTTTTANSPISVNSTSISATNLTKQDTLINNRTEITKRRTMEQSKEKESNKKIKTQTQSETWKCNDCWVPNEANSDKCVCCGAAKPTKSVSKAEHCSVCKVALSQERLDKCANCEKVNNKVDGLVTNSNVTYKLQQSYLFTDCCTNIAGLDKCVWCSDKKSEELPAVIKGKPDNASEWKCDYCWIKNKSSADKCAACGSTSPQSKTKEHLSQPQIGIQTSSDSTLKSIMSSQCEKWECTNCLVRNDKNRSKCVCCDAEKSGKTKASEGIDFNFGTLKNTTFKFGIDRNQNISENKTESLPVTQLEMPAKQSETNNNNVPEHATFTFGIPKVKTSNKITTEKETIAEGASTPTFIFGVSKSIIPSASADTTVFRSPINEGSKFSERTPSKTSLENDEKIQEVPNIEQPNTSASDNIQKPAGLFGIPLSPSSVGKTPSAGITFGQTKQPANTQAVATAATDANVPQSTFSFPGSGNSGLQLFPAVTTASTSSISFPIIAPSTSSISFFQKSEPVSTTSMQLFSKTDPIPSSLSLFNKNETVTTNTAVAAPLLSSAPVFSFGTNTQNTKIEKPKFNFSFGKTSEIRPVFSLPTSNTGNNLAGNGLSSGNITSANTISGGNGLATGNSKAGGSSLSSNSIASGLIGGPTKKDNIMWPSNNEVSAIKMGAGNSIEQGNNNLPPVQPSNLFSLQAKKENTWSLNQNTTLGSLKLPSGNTVDPAKISVGNASGTMFGTPDKKENMWSMNNSSSNMFAQIPGTNNVQKPATFSFGSSMQFNANNVTPASTFGNPTQPQAQNMFGISTQVNNNQSVMFSPTLQSQAPPNIFGAQAVSNTAPSVGMFATPNAGATPFGALNSSVPTFEVAPLNPVTPTFNFGAQQTTGVFGFGQQQAQSQGGVYKFGAQAAGSPQRQFNIGTAGSAANAVSRRPMRRAVRRTNQR
ncbi:nuclear pore complex protein Nup153 isoform X2 [Maniola jurtina]|uniref:nuclear pore complex protein Nup153 isoform X2 n=1 Tax=Maniola jurtina TaxID=191418 RepID=UPI001E686B1D|nr:nuclear pore complex protein Nup153 isoform X2 [Maniola jurtina]